MKKLHSVKMLAALTIVAASSIQGYTNDCEGPLDRGRWYIMPKVGAAPGLFAGRGYEQRVQILGGTATADRTVTCVNGTPIVTNTDVQYNALQQDNCRVPKFNQIFSNGVLNVGFEVGRNVCDNTQMYLEFVYNRASGKCLTQTTRNYAAPVGCSAENCSSNTNCAPTGPLLSESTRTSSFDNYVAYGAFIGTRHYWDWNFCDRIQMWSGFKFGLFHRKAVNACISIPEATVPVGSAQYTFAARENINVGVFCKGNSVAGGLNLGFDYCFSDCLTVLVGVEVVASCGFKSNNNVRLPLGTVTPVGSAPVIPTGAFPQPTNIIIGNTGTFVQFPVWAGLRWEFDFCKSAC